MKITYHYANGKSFTTPRLVNAFIGFRSISTTRKIDNSDLKDGEQIIQKVATGVSSVRTGLYGGSEEIEQRVSLKAVQIERIDIKTNNWCYYEHIVDNAILYGWKVNARKLSDKMQSYNMIITLTRPSY